MKVGSKDADPVRIFCATFRTKLCNTRFKRQDLHWGVVDSKMFFTALKSDNALSLSLVNYMNVVNYSVHIYQLSIVNVVNFKFQTLCVYIYFHFSCVNRQRSPAVHLPL